MDIQKVKRIRRRSLDAHKEWQGMKNEAMAEHLGCSLWAAREFSRGRPPTTLSDHQIKEGHKWIKRREKLWEIHMSGTLRALGDLLYCSKDKVASMLKEREPSAPCAPNQEVPREAAEFLTMRLSRNPVAVAGYY